MDGHDTNRQRRGASQATAGHSQSLLRGLRILDAISASARGLTLSELSQTVGLAPSTAHRLLKTLEHEEFVQQDPELAIWRIGVKAFRIGSAFLAARDVVGAARPALHELTRATGETANLAVEEDGYAVFLAQTESQEMMRMIVRLGSRAPLHASGVGKALLAWMPAARIERILQRRGLSRLTPRTLDNPASLHADLAASRRQGFAVDREEHAVGLHCAAATIHDETGAPIAAISVSGPKARIPEARLTELGGLVARTARTITDKIGGRLPAPDSNGGPY